jgi:DNA-binding NtrC family response regulator
LLVDDDACLARAYGRFLTRGGYRVFSEAAAGRALSRFRYQRIDVVISDIVMPEMSGEEFVWRVRCLRPDLPVILMSAHRTGVRMDNKTAEYTRFLRKPVRRTDLLRTVSGLLEARCPRALH